MLFVIIILLGIIAGVSVGINLTFFRKLKEVVLDNEGLRKSLYNADNTIGKLRIGNNKLSEILRKRDSTIADMTAMFETSMDLPEEGKFEDWRNRLLNRHRQPELILASTMGSDRDSMLMEHVMNPSENRPNSFKNFYKDFEISPADLNAEDSLLWAQANPPMQRFVEFTDIDVKIAKDTSDILEPQLASYLKWEKEQEEDDRPSKIPGVEPATTVMPALEPLSIEEKHE